MSDSFSKTRIAVLRVFIAFLLLAAFSQFAAVAPAAVPILSIQTASAQGSADADTIITSRRHRRSRSVIVGPETLIVNRGGRHGGINVDVDDKDHGGDIVLMGDDVFVDKDEVVSGDAVAIGGSVTVMGKVMGDIVAIGGNVTLGDSAVVGGDAVSVGGGVNRATGARVGGQVVNVGVNIPFPFLGKHNLVKNKVHNAVLDLVRWIIFYMLMFAAAALCVYFARDRIAYAGNYMSREPVWSFVLGVLSPALVLVAAVLLCITLIGIFVAIPLILLYPVFLFMGWVVSGHRIGAAASGERAVTLRTVFTGLIIVSGLHIFGLLFRAIGISGFPIFLLHLLGFTISFTAALVGLGAMLGTRFRRPPEATAPAAYYPVPGDPAGPVPPAPVLPPGSTYTPPAVSRMSSPADEGRPEG